MGLPLIGSFTLPTFIIGFIIIFIFRWFTYKDEEDELPEEQAEGAKTSHPEPLTEAVPKSEALQAKQRVEDAGNRCFFGALTIYRLHSRSFTWRRVFLPNFIFQTTF